VRSNSYQHEIRAQGALEHPGRANDWAAVNDHGLGFIQPALFVPDMGDEARRQGCGSCVRARMLFRQLHGVGVATLGRQDSELLELYQPPKAKPIDRREYIPSILVVGEGNPWRGVDTLQITSLPMAKSSYVRRNVGRPWIGRFSDAGFGDRQRCLTIVPQRRDYRSYGFAFAFYGIGVARIPIADYPLDFGEKLKRIFEPHGERQPPCDCKPDLDLTLHELDGEQALPA